MRTEHDFLGEMQVEDNVYYGIQTLRAIENFKITGEKLDPDFIKAIAIVKKAACLTNMETGRMPEDIGNAMEKWQTSFPWILYKAVPVLLLT